ncbi:MAG: iron-containing alcohol dehydrogenase family protein, partial [Bradymonadaceae bacterium]
MDEYSPFRFEYDTPTIRFGDEVVADLADELADQGLDRALVVTGTSVGSNPDVMDPIAEGLGDLHVGTFDETTPDKLLSTAVDGLDAVRETDADVLVAVGGGSSLDVAKGLSTLASRTDSPEEAGSELQSSGGIDVGDADPLPIVAVPTTLAGADMSIVAGIGAEADSGLVDEDCGGGLSDPALMPTAAFHDPALFATTPKEILAGSAMNGFNKGLETIYSRHATPVTDATAAKGIGLMARGLHVLGTAQPTTSILRPAVEGVILVQYGIGRPNVTTLSLIHAFGHTLRDGFDIQQGTAHAVVTPAALQYIFDEVDGRRELIAEALGVGDADDPVAAVVDEVAD